MSKSAWVTVIIVLLTVIIYRIEKNANDATITLLALIALEVAGVTEKRK